MNSRARNYIQAVNSQQRGDSIPYEEALKNRKLIEDLREELEATKVLLKAAESRCCNYWMTFR